MSIPIVIRCLLAVLALTLSDPAWADPIRGLFSTGVDSAGNRIAQGGVPDVHYTVEGHRGVTYPHPAYYVTAEGQWIAAHGDGGYATPMEPDPGGPSGIRAGIAYTLTFDLGNLDPRSARIVGSFGADNAAEVQINGIPVARTASFYSPTRFAITSGFRRGANTLTFLVTDYCPPSGLIVHGLSGTADPLPPVRWQVDGWGEWSSACGPATRSRIVSFPSRS